MCGENKSCQTLPHWTLRPSIGWYFWTLSPIFLITIFFAGVDYVNSLIPMPRILGTSVIQSRGQFGFLILVILSLLVNLYIAIKKRKILKDNESLKNSKFWRSSPPELTLRKLRLWGTFFIAMTLFSLYFFYASYFFSFPQCNPPSNHFCYYLAISIGQIILLHFSTYLGSGLNQNWLNELKNQPMPSNFKEYLIRHKEMDSFSYPGCWRYKDGLAQRLNRTALLNTFFIDRKGNNNWEIRLRFITWFIAPIMMPISALFIYTLILSTTGSLSLIRPEALIIISMIWGTWSIVWFSYLARFILDESSSIKQDLAVFQFPYLNLTSREVWGKKLSNLFSNEGLNIMKVVNTVIVATYWGLLSVIYNQ